ncbi:MAG TPA: MFS transporter [Thermaerobacter sp.]
MKDRQERRGGLGLPFAVLCSVPFVMVLSNSMLIPVLPLLQRAMDRNLFQVGLIITAFSIPAGLAIPAGGYLSDRLGRKPVMIPALILFGLGGLVGGIAPLVVDDPYPWIIGGRILQGLAAGGLYQVALAAAGDMYQGDARTRAMGVLEASNGLGKIISPILGSALALLAWYAPFFAYPALSGLAALGLWLLVEEPRNRRSAPALPRYLGRMKHIFREKGVSLLVSFLAGFAALFVLFGLLSVYSDLLEKPFGIRGFVKGFVVAIPVAVATVTAFVSGIVLQGRLARALKAVLVGGLGILGAGLAFLYFARGLISLVAGTSVVGFGYGLALPALNTLITSSVPSAERGGVTALYGTVRFFGAALGPPAFSLMLEGGRGVLYLLPAAGAAVILALVAFLLRQDVLARQEGRQDEAAGQAGRQDAAARQAREPVEEPAEEGQGSQDRAGAPGAAGVPVPLGPWSRARSSFPQRLFPGRRPSPAR